MRAVVGGLAISPFQIPLDCSGLHIIHVLEDELCFWRPSDETRSELLLRSAQVTLVSAAGMRSAKECVGKSYHSYSSFVLNHDRLPRAEPRAILCLQHVLACIPADDWVGNGNMFFFASWMGCCLWLTSRWLARFVGTHAAWSSRRRQ